MVRLCLGVLLGLALHAQTTPIVFVGAKLIPIDGREIEAGSLVVHNGKIVAVGASVSAPAGARRVDATGKVIMPGLVDSHSHIGGPEGADGSAPRRRWVPPSISLHC